MMHTTSPRSKLQRYLASQGFTLIEIMVAVVLLLSAMAGIVPFFLGGLSQASTVRCKSVATNLARERMEEIRQLDYREIGSAESLAERFGSTATQRSTTHAISYLVEESSYEEGTLKKVTVNVSWTAPPKVSAASITTMIHQQFLGPRGSFLEVTPVFSDPRGSPFPLIAGSTKARYHIAQADWGLVFVNLDQAEMAARNVYMRLVLFDDLGQSISLGDSDNDLKINNSYLRYSTGPDGKVSDIWFEYDFDANTIPDGYWEMRAIAYNEYDQPGNIWRLRVRVEKSQPAMPTTFVATPQADNQTVVLTWAGGSERDRAYYVLERRKWEESGWSALWTTVAADLNPMAGTYTDQGSQEAQDPWGNDETQNRYQYRLWAVDRCNPGNPGEAAQTETVIPSAVSTTTTLGTTTTVPPTTSTTSPSTTSTTLAEYSAVVKNSSGQTYSLIARDSEGNTVYNGSVNKNKAVTITNLPLDNYLITATSPDEPTLTQSFSIPAQAGQIVLTIW